MPITRRITETQYQKDIADAEKRGFAAARERLDDDPGSPQPLTRAQIAEMKPEEINERWGDVCEALTREDATPEAEG